MGKDENPYEILGLNKDANSEEVEKKYSLLALKYKGNPQLNNSGITIDDINRAYRKIKGFATDEEIDEMMKNMSKRKKISNFIYYHKGHFILGILALVLVISLGRAILRPKPDFNTAIIGAYYYEDTEPLKMHIEDNIEEINLVSIDGASFVSNDASMDYNIEMKATVLMVAGEIDLFIVDSNRFQGYANMAGFEQLDSYLEELGLDASSDRVYYAKSDEDDKKYAYGIDVSDCEAINDIMLAATSEKIACIRVATENFDKALEVIKLLLN